MVEIKYSNPIQSKPSTPLNSNGKILMHPIDKAHVQKLYKYFANIAPLDNGTCNEPTLDYLHKHQGCPISLTDRINIK